MYTNPTREPRIEKLTYQLCNEIDDLQEQLNAMIKDRDYYRDLYRKSISDSIDTSQRTTVGLLALALAPLDPKFAKRIADHLRADQPDNPHAPNT